MKPIIIRKHNGRWVHSNRGGISPTRACATILAFALGNTKVLQRYTH